MPRVFVGTEELFLRPDAAFPPGREGTVYHDPSDPDFVIKLPHFPDDEWRDKLAAMLASPLNSPDVAWPTEPVLSSDRTTVIGYRMPFARKKHSIVVLFSTEPVTRWLNADYAFRLGVAINLATTVDRIHRHGCVVGDISLTNILVGKDGTVCFIDTDSFQTRNGRVFRCKVGTADYTPAELHGVEFADIDRTVHHDAFGLGEMLFQLLVGPGTHPFAARYVGSGTPLTQAERIPLGIWPYATRGHLDYLPRTGAPLDLLHPLLRPLVFRCFEAGHGRPDERPLPADWLLVLNDVKQDSDFVHVVAPQLEAECQARQRQAALSGAAPRPRHSPNSSAPSTPCPASHRRLLNRRLWTTATASLLLAVATTAIFTIPTAPRIKIVPRASQPLPTPPLYRTLSDESPNHPSPPPDKTRSESTPPLYKAFADKYR